MNREGSTAPRAARVEAVARFANAHPLIVAALFLVLAVGVVGLAVFGAISLLMQPSLPKLCFAAAVAVAAWIMPGAITERGTT